MVKINGSWLVTGETSFDDDVSDAGTVAYCIKEDLEDAGGLDVEEVIPFDIQSRSRKAAEEIAKSIWGKDDLEGSGHSILIFEDIIARHFAEGEE